MVRDEPIFSVDELKANEERKRKLIDLIKSGDAVLMAGAGCSASLYPSWRSFVDHLDGAAKEIIQHLLQTKKISFHLQMLSKNV